MTRRNLFYIDGEEKPIKRGNIEQRSQGWGPSPEKGMTGMVENKATMAGTRSAQWGKKRSRGRQRLLEKEQKQNYSAVPGVWSTPVHHNYTMLVVVIPHTRPSPEALSAVFNSIPQRDLLNFSKVTMLYNWR